MALAGRPSTMPKVLSLVGAKGGPLKTASAAAIAHLAATAGLRVALLDADPQADLTCRSGYTRVGDPLSARAVEIAYADGRTAELFRGGRSMEGADLAGAAAQLARARETGADLVIVDTPPALGPLTTAAVRASDLVLVPAVPGRESVERIHDVLHLATSQGCGTIRVVLTLANRRSNLLRWTAEQVDALYPGVRLAPVVPVEICAGEAGVFGKPVTLYAPRSASAAAYRTLTDELLAAMGLVEPVPGRTAP